MALTITTPIATVGGIATDVIATKAQALYGLAREDHQVDEVAAFVTGLAVWLTGDFTTLYNDGDILFVSRLSRTSDNATVVPAGHGAISGTPVFAGGFTKINVVIDDVVTTYPGVSIDGYINNLTVRANYRVDVELYELTTKLLDRTVVFGLPQSGAEEIDVKSTLLDYMRINDLQYVEYHADFTEVWDGSAESPATTADLLAVLGRKQILKTGGALMYEFLCDLGTDALFLTRFANPIMFRGWKRTVSFIIDSGFAARTGDSSLEMQENNVDINKGTPTSLANTPYAIATPRVQEHPITESTNSFTELELNALASDSQCMQDLYYEMQDECLQPIMIEWLNSLGGYEQFLFTINQDFDNNGGAGEDVNSPIIGNINVFTGGKSRLVGESFQTIKMSAERLKRDQMIALAEIKNSDFVRVFLNKTGTVWVKAKVRGNLSTPFNSQYDVHTFDLEIELPDNFDFFEAKLY